MHVVEWEEVNKKKKTKRVAVRDTFRAANRFLITLGNIFVGNEQLMVMNVITKGCLIVPLSLVVVSHRKRRGPFYRPMNFYDLNR